MTRLIDADALLEAVHKKQNEVYYNINLKDYLQLIGDAPTVQREGWVMVEELQKVYDDMFKHKDIAISANSLFKLIQAAPTDTE